MTQNSNTSAQGQKTTGPEGITADRAQIMQHFDAKYYLKSYPDVAKSNRDPLEHYLKYGWRNFYNPSESFDSIYYQTCISGITHPDTPPLLHYTAIGAGESLPTNRSESLKVGGYQLHWTVLVERFPELRKYFDEVYYTDRYPDVVLHQTEALSHFLDIGWKQGRNPSGHFDTLFYHKRFMFGDVADLCPLIHYIRYGKAIELPTSANGVPTISERVKGEYENATNLKITNVDTEVAAVMCGPQFDRNYYLRRYEDVRIAGVDPYWHYVKYGYREGRWPSKFLDPIYYEYNFMSETAKKKSPLLHYSTVGRALGLPGSAVLTIPIMEETSDAIWTEWLKSFLSLIGVETSSFQQQRVKRFIIPLYSDSYYRKIKEIPAHVSNINVFIKYLVSDLPGGLPPSLVFSETHYRKEVYKNQGRLISDSETPFHHWLYSGVDINLSPNPLFIPSDYLHLNPDLNDYPSSLFEHFIRHGINEGRRFSRLTSIASSSIHTHNFSYSEQAKSFLAAGTLSLETADAENSKYNMESMLDFHASSQMKSLIAGAAALDPNIGHLEDNIESLVPPWHDISYCNFQAIVDLLPSQEFDSIVFMPFCKLGGADFVGGVLSKTLNKNGRSIIIRTDSSDWARPDWFDENQPSIDISLHLSKIPYRMRLLIIYRIISHLGVKKVFNVNSRLAFDLFDVYGERLKMQAELYAYFFCADFTVDGDQVGYPVWYFSKILANLDAALIDNASLAKQLIDRYSLTGALANKIKIVYTPIMSAHVQKPIIEKQLSTTGGRQRKKILWAGRLDYQKRFEVVVDIARLMPDVDFEAWGKAVLDKEPDLSNLPSNLKVNAPFKDYDELPLESSDGWLYTSRWDGVPTILIEVSSFGMPVVASAVGGVPELIIDNCGWLVAPDAEASAYVSALRELLSSPEQRAVRAASLRQHVHSQHSVSAYMANISDILYANEGETK